MDIISLWNDQDTVGSVLRVVNCLPLVSPGVCGAAIPHSGHLGASHSEACGRV